MNIVADLRSLNTRAAKKYDRFREECDNDKVAVDDRRHNRITYLACAISVREQVKSK